MKGNNEMNKKKLIISTGNIHKVNEIRYILKKLPIEVLSKEDIGLKEFAIEENGRTLEENAIKKAEGLSRKVEGIVIADDTGLFVDYLGGRPGVYSSRYAGIGATYEDNNEKLLKELEGVPFEERTAYFKTVIAIIKEDGEIKIITGLCNGKIGFELRGNEGFGYDPLFIVEGYDKTFAELGENIKNKISHRAKALEKLKIELKRIIRDD